MKDDRSRSGHASVKRDYFILPCRMDNAGTGVTVNASLPGPTLSEGVQEMLLTEQERSGKTMEEVAAAFVAAQRPSSIIRRAATVEEVANLVVYVASPLSFATTGAALRVDGGVVDTIA